LETNIGQNGGKIASTHFVYKNDENING